jgi:hypothetical protein
VCYFAHAQAVAAAIAMNNKEAVLGLPLECMHDDWGTHVKEAGPRKTNSPNTGARVNK